jgi:predicted Zn-dependent protease with MMP-like domain
VSPPAQERFTDLVADAIDDLPEWVARAMNNVEILVEEEPPAQEPHLLGRYVGIPLIDRDRGYTGVMPDRIVLFAGPIRREARRHGERVRAVITSTLVHEVAHHFGIDDDRLHELDAY